MKVEMKETIFPAIIKSSLLIIFGLLLTFMAEATLISISYLLGGILCSIGAVALVQYFKSRDEGGILRQFNIVYGLITIFAGIFLILRPNVVSSIIPIILGLVIMVNSAFKLQQVFMLKTYKNPFWRGSLVTAVLGMICGLVILLNPFQAASVVTQVIGIFILVYAILDIISTVMFRKTVVSVSVALSSDVREDKREDYKKGKRVKDATVLKEVKKETKKEESGEENE